MGTYTPPSASTHADPAPRKARPRTSAQKALLEKLVAEQGQKPTWEENLGVGRDLWNSEAEFEAFLEAMGRPIGGRK